MSESNTNGAVVPESVKDRLADDSALPNGAKSKEGKSKVNSLESLMRSINARTKQAEKLGVLKVRGSVALPDGERISAKLHRASDIDDADAFYNAVDQSYALGNATVSRQIEKDITGKVIARGSFRIDNG